MLTIEGLARRYPGTMALDNVYLSVPHGSFVGVIGRSDAGKSTLLRLILHGLGEALAIAFLGTLLAA